MRWYTTEWRAMGCAAQARVLVSSPEVADHLLAHTMQMVEHLEDRWSRFREHSDIRRLNRSVGRTVSVDPSTIALLEAMVSGYAVTEGAFNPTMLASLVGLGYGSVGHDVSAMHSAHLAAARGARLSGIAVDRVRNVARIPAGTWLDAGGIGKGLAADMVAEKLVELGAVSAMVSLGGDLRIAGEPVDDGWPVLVADPFDDQAHLAQLAVGSGGVATSGTTLRQWEHDGSVVHHILDPLTGVPLATGAGQVVQATVVAGTGAWADVLATKVLVGGLCTLAGLDEMGIAALAVLSNRTVHTNEHWTRFRAVHTTRAA